MQINGIDIDEILLKFKYFLDLEINEELTINDIKIKFQTFSKEKLLLLGAGGTISSGYTPTDETIVPLSPSPAIKQLEYIKLFGISRSDYNNVDAFAKDSRDIDANDLLLLLKIIYMCPNDRVFVTAGTYLLPKLAYITKLAMKMFKSNKVVVFTGSILPAGFMASDADANVWSSITMINYLYKNNLSDVYLVFHGETYTSEDDLEKLDLHPYSMRKMVIQYPLHTVPVYGIL